MRSVSEIADSFVEAYTVADPVRASRIMGIGRDSPRLTDYSPEGHAATAGVMRSTLAALDEATPTNESERLGYAYLHDWCRNYLALLDAGEFQQAMNAIAGPPSMIRMSFDVMPTATEADWENVACRLEAVPEALQGYRSSLDAAAAKDAASLASQRLVETVVDQCRRWGEGWFTGFAARYQDGGLTDRLRTAARGACEAYTDLARWLGDDLLPQAPQSDGVGADRYRLWAQFMLGATLDLDDTYEWAVDELVRINAEKELVCADILPDASVQEVQAHLNTGGAGEVVEGVDAYRNRVQAIVDEAIAGLAGVEFDIVDELRRCVVGIPPTGTALAPYYSPPNEDFTQPATTWFPVVEGTTRFPMWGDFTTAYHEAVPGHHLQLGLTRVLPLVRAQRVGGNVAHSEGWALYAERLMDELGWFRTPETRLGFLSMQAFRAARVVVDIGLHTGRKGWTFDSAVAAMADAGGKGPAFATSEVLRYLSWPSQAIAYKLGERSWLRGRSLAMERAGQHFDRRNWHSRALALGPLGLDHLDTELVTIAGTPDK